MTRARGCDGISHRLQRHHRRIGRSLQAQPPAADRRGLPERTSLGGTSRLCRSGHRLHRPRGTNHRRDATGDAQHVILDLVLPYACHDIQLVAIADRLRGHAAQRCGRFAAGLAVVRGCSMCSVTAKWPQRRTASREVQCSTGFSPMFPGFRRPTEYRGARIRTGDLTDPNGARYQAAPRPDVREVSHKRAGAMVARCPPPRLRSWLSWTRS